MYLEIFLFSVLHRILLVRPSACVPEQPIPLGTGQVFGVIELSILVSESPMLHVHTLSCFLPFHDCRFCICKSHIHDSVFSVCVKGKIVQQVSMCTICSIGVRL